MAEMEHPMIKICGVQDVATARHAIAQGTGALGFMLAPSRRRIAPEAVAGIIAKLPPGRARMVGVVVNESAAAIDEIMRTTGVDVIQLSGDETPDLLDGLNHVVWKALRFPAGTSVDDARRSIDPWLSGTRPVAAVLVDASVPGHYGGTGHVADWDLVARLAEAYPIMLAGGLNPGNVAAAIAQIRPAGVDVSSGVERDGVKDAGLIQDFLTAGQGAFAQVNHDR